jgi:DNA-binding response OmpR family regulator
MANILVVDDDLDMADCCAEVLRAEGHSARIARNGAEGLALVAAEKPDLILLDVEMPVLNGPDMAYRMFLNNVGQEQIPILLTSGVLDIRSVAENVGTPYYLGKPFSVERLLAVVARALVEQTAPKPRLREDSDITQQRDRS